MTNHDYKAIADRLVERGILEKCQHHSEWYRVASGEPELKQWIDARQVPHDWRVAGRCLEVEPEKVLWIMRRALSLVEARKIELTLAIILAYLEATDA